MTRLFGDFLATRMTGNEGITHLAPVYARMLEQGAAHKTSLPDTENGIVQGLVNLRNSLRRKEVDIFRIDTPTTRGAGAIFLSPVVASQRGEPVIGGQVDDIVTMPRLRGQGVGSFGLAAAAAVMRQRGGTALTLECEAGMCNDDGYIVKGFYERNGLTKRRDRVPYRIDDATLTKLLQERPDNALHIRVAPLAQINPLRYLFHRAAARMTQTTTRPLTIQHPVWDTSTWIIGAWTNNGHHGRKTPLAFALAAQRWSLFRTAQFRQKGFGSVQGTWEHPVGAQIEWIKFGNTNIDKVHVARAMIGGLVNTMRTTGPQACSFIDLIGCPRRPFDSALAHSFSARQNTYSGAPEELWIAQGRNFIRLSERVKPGQIVLKA